MKLGRCETHIIYRVNLLKIYFISDSKFVNFCFYYKTTILLTAAVTVGAF